MNYLQFHFQITPFEEGKDILIAHLYSIGFDGFEELDSQVVAYIEDKIFDPKKLKELSILKENGFNINFNKENLPDKNWNEVWESNFSPISIDTKLIVRAPFHSVEKGEYEKEIIINPKMAFGTGHHATTYLVLKAMLETDFTHQKVLDMGCGTGVLGILARMKNAAEVVAVDNDEWSYENAKENSELNGVEMFVKKGEIEQVRGKKFNTILANITRNVLIHYMEYFAKLLEAKGNLFLSGFYIEDVPCIIESASKYGLQMESVKDKDNWAMIKLRLSN